MRRILCTVVLAAVAACGGGSVLGGSRDAAMLEVRVRPTDRMEMIHIPAGTFAMGNGGLSWLRFTGRLFLGTLKLHPLKNETPRHMVYLDGFWIDRTEVTVGQFRRFVQATGYRTTAERDGWGKPWRDLPQAHEWPRTEGVSWLHPRDPESTSRDDHPVVQVSWDDAVAYCRWAGARLPTEAEWEKAARGTDGRRFPWGDEFDPGRLNHCDSLCPVTRWRDPEHADGFAFTAPVGSYPDGASPYGVLDMVGNVWEWAADWYDARYYRRSSPTNPAGPDSGTVRAMRGASWYDGEPNAWLTTTVRHQNPPWDRYEDVGFRCAVSAESTAEEESAHAGGIIVPLGSAVIIDGVLGEREWVNAAVMMMNGGRHILLQHDSTNLYLAVRGQEQGWVHLATLLDDRILVAHASAALGSFEYARADSTWLLVRRTGWSLRDTSQTEDARQARAHHLREHGWVASTAWMGTPDVREFTIDLRLMAPFPLRLAVLYATDETVPRYAPWPRGLRDGVMSEALMMGRAPGRLVFHPGTWGALVLGGRVLPGQTVPTGTAVR